jgi:hypothetical protein
MAAKISFAPPQTHAERCLELATQAWDPVLKENLTQAAQRWTRLASDLANTSDPTHLSAGYTAGCL